MSDTPRVDALVDREIKAGVSLGESEIYDFARQLERENAALKARMQDTLIDLRKGFTNSAIHRLEVGVGDDAIDATFGDV